MRLCKSLFLASSKENATCSIISCLHVFAGELQELRSQAIFDLKELSRCMGITGLIKK